MSRFAHSDFYGAARAVSLIAVSCFLTACSGRQTSRAPHSSAAASLARLFWPFVIVCGGVRLLGKQDLVPGRTNYLKLRADKPALLFFALALQAAAILYLPECQG